MCVFMDVCGDGYVCMSVCVTTCACVDDRGQQLYYGFFFFRKEFSLNPEFIDSVRLASNHQSFLSFSAFSFSTGMTDGGHHAHILCGFWESKLMPLALRAGPLLIEPSLQVTLFKAIKSMLNAVGAPCFTACFVGGLHRKACCSEGQSFPK